MLIMTSWKIAKKSGTLSRNAKRRFEKWKEKQPDLYSRERKSSYKWGGAQERLGYSFSNLGGCYGI